MKWIKEPLTLLGIGLSLTGLTLVLLGVAYIDTQPWNTIITHLGSVLIGAGVVELIIHYYASERWIKRAVEQILRAMNFPIAAFYETRDALVPLSDELKDVDELWGAWHTGRVAYTKDIFGPRRVSKAKVILTHPESNQIKELEKVCGMGANALASDIKELTKALKQQNVTVKWFKGPVCNSLIIANPQKDNAWVRVEVLVPRQTVEKRPSFRIEKSTNKELFNTFYHAFEEMWRASESA